MEIKLLTYSFFGLMDCNIQSTLFNVIEFTFYMQNITTARTLLQEERKNPNSCQHELRMWYIFIT